MYYTDPSPRNNNQYNNEKIVRTSPDQPLELRTFAAYSMLPPALQFQLQRFLCYLMCKVLRAAFKILELNEKYNFLMPGSKVVDLGCAPGGWSQVAVDLVNACGVKKNVKIGSVIGIDLQEMEVLPGAKFYQIDFMANDADLEVKNILEGKANVIMSDMAASSSGHKKTDHLRIMALCETAAYFAFDVLEEGGTFVAKVLAGGAESDLQTLLKQKFTKVYNVKPPSSRSDSSEKFVVALGFRG